MYISGAVQKSQPFLADFRTDTVSQKSDSPTHNDEDEKHGSPYEHECSPFVH